MKNMKKIITVFVILVLLFSVISFSSCKPKKELSKGKPLNVIIMWHNHQPFYKNPVSGEYILPWVRLHGVKDYYRMPYIVSQHPDIKVSFDLSGSLIAQLKDYLNGAKDTREIISLIPPEKLTETQKWEILQIPGGFFDINWAHIINKVPMYKDILDKRQEIFKKYGSLPEKERIEKITSTFSNQYYTNLIALFNLFWMDNEYVKNDSSLKPLYDKAFNNNDYTEADIQKIMNAQNMILKKILPEYKKLLDKKQIEVVTTPYAHPISALLMDFGWDNDLKMQIDKANTVFKSTFGSEPKGVWAPECAINDAALNMFHNAGWNWTISDADNLSKLGMDVGKDPLAKFMPYSTDGVTVFFRDKYLSDGIGFRYSGKSVQDAVNDVANTLLNVEKQNTNGNLVYTIALDGENAWENYNNDGNDFLNAFYKKLSDLQKEGKIRTITPSEYIKEFGKGKTVPIHNVTTLNLKNKDISDITRYSDLPTETVSEQFGESSWVNPTLDTWIGEKQENMGWMILKDARNAFLESNVNGDAKTEAEEDLMRAEGSDWFWWYGNDQDSGNDMGFDRLFKMYLFKVYRLIGKTPPAYLFGNYFPDGAPYRSTTLYLEKGKFTNVPVLQQNTEIKLMYDGKFIEASINAKTNDIKTAIFDGKSIKKPFFLINGVPSAFHMNPFPYDSSNIGIPIDELFEVTSTGRQIQNKTISIDINNLDKSNIYIAFAGNKEDGTFIPYTIPIHIKLPLEIKGNVVGELLDDKGDDNGPGTYQYPLDPVFKNAGKGLFDLVSFKMIDSGESYMLQYKMANLGGNPWNGPNGMSFQILETYIDFKNGGKTSTITKGPNVQLDKKHPWDIALRIAGWSYGNYIELANGTIAQGELTISVDQKNNIITVALPKKYIQLSKSYKPYVAIISGSQDGYGVGYWRQVLTTASEWQLGGADPDAFNAGISPNVCDIFVPKGKTQSQILRSYNANSKTLATIPFLPLEKIKPLPKIVEDVKAEAEKTVKPADEIPINISLENIGKGIQKDDPSNDEFTLEIPDKTTVIQKSIKSTKGKVEIENNVLKWNGSIKPGENVKINFLLKLDKDIPNGKLIDLKGVVFEDSNGDGKDDEKVSREEKFFVNYTVTLTVYLEKNTFTRNGEVWQIDPVKHIQAVYIDKWDDVGAPVEQIVKALGGTYKFSPKENNVTIQFMGNKLVHWIGQNKFLLNNSAMPLYPGNPDVRSFIKEGIPILPLKSIAYAFNLKYSFNKDKSVVKIQYLP